MNNISANSYAKRALVIGVSGQDGSLLARFLLNKGYEVWGTSRDVKTQNFNNHIKLNTSDQIKILEWSTQDLASLVNIISMTSPDEIYNLSGQTSVGMSFTNPVEAFNSIVLTTHYLLEAVRKSNQPIRLFNAASSECFGNTFSPVTESSPLNPFSPYGVAKASAFLNVANYRNIYDLFCLSGILFNHDSPLRPNHFVLKKVTQTAKRIALGSDEKLELGDISIIRDWGWAPDYVEGMWLMLQQDEPKDYILASGKSHSLAHLVETTFSLLNLDWQDHVTINHSFKRPMEILESRANPSLAENNLGWKAKLSITELLDNMINDAI